jgi:hypothetical protein
MDHLKHGLSLSDMKGRSEKDLESDGLRALVFGREPDGSRVMYDCAVQGRTANKQIQRMAYSHR